MSYRIALMVATGALAISTASAQDNNGYYGEVGVGYALDSNDNDNDFESQSNTFPNLDAQEFDSELELSGGPVLYGAIGKYFDRGLRGEFELAYRTRDVEQLPGDDAGFLGFPARADDLGEMNVWTGMVNVYKDFAFDAAGRFSPYLGAGIGFAKVRGDFNNIPGAPALTDGALNAATSPVAYRIVTSNDDYVAAFQGMAGVNIGLSETATFKVGYRYLQTDEYDFEAYVNNEVANVTGEYRDHEILVGLRFAFGGAPAAAPAPQPVAQPAPQPRTKTCFDGTVVPVGQACPEAEEQDQLTPEELRTVVYFDFDEANLTPAARSLLQRRANEARSVDLIEVLVSGNTDTAGSASYNERLSARRAQVVREALVGFGVDPGKIQVRALGESNLAKPTQDGVREPLNRRTEIEFDF